MILHTVARFLARPAVTTAVLLPALLLPASAAGAEDVKPPKQMSAVGGERLGRSGDQVEPLPGQDAPGLPKKLTSRSWIVADAETGEVLAARNAHWPLAPASTIKMLFADTLLPKFDKETEHMVLPEDLAALGAGSSAVGVKEDHSYTVEDLWNGVFLSSGNDAVHVLAAMNGGLAQTVREMNDHAEKLGAGDTTVVSPDGYDAEGQVSSAYDLTLIARSGMQKPDFRTYASTVRTQFPGGGSGDEREHFEIQNTNRLLIGDLGLDPYEGLAGIKNGYTSEAGYTFTGVAQRGDRKLLVTAMHPEKGHHRVYEETAALLDWGFEAAGKVEPVGELVPPLAEQRRVDAAGGKNGEEGETGLAGGSRVAAGEAPARGGTVTALGVSAAMLLALAGVGVLLRHRPTAAERAAGTAAGRAGRAGGRFTPRRPWTSRRATPRAAADLLPGPKE